MELIYIKTDKNGTKYFHDWNCPRCGGIGFADKWAYTGRVCYACGGSGKRSVAKVVREYTPEYWSKLEARRQAKAAKYAEEHAEEIEAEKAEQERKDAEWRKAENEREFARMGCGKDGLGFVLCGNTYPVKEEIKANGGKWVAQTWVCPVEVKGKGISAVKINLNEFINDYGLVDTGDALDIIFCISCKKMSYAEAKEQVAEWNR